MEKQEIVITDIQIPFSRMVAIILKWMLASIPAIILMYVVMIAIVAVFAVAFGVGLGGLAALLASH